MKKVQYYILLIMLFFFNNSCKKNNNNTNSGIASLNVVNALSDISSVYVYFTPTPTNYYLQQSPIYTTSGAEYGIHSGPGPVIIVSAEDTSKPLYQGIFNPKVGNIYSLYLSGKSSQIDTLFLEDIIPLISDSSSGVRFINLSPDSHPLNINLKGNYPNQYEFNNLGYKQISFFKNYLANSSVNGQYNFELRDAISGDLLTEFTWNYTLHKNNTLVISGSVSSLSETPMTVFQVNNY